MPASMTRTFAAPAAALACLLLAACASRFPADAIRPGDTRDAVLTRLGQPSRVLALPDGGQRLQYALQPGQRAWMIDLDAAERVTRSRQVLHAEGFARIAVDAWTREDVVRELGPPARVERAPGWDGPVLAYRWRDARGTDRIQWIHLDPQGVVRRLQAGVEGSDRLAATP